MVWTTIGFFLIAMWACYLANTYRRDWQEAQETIDDQESTIGTLSASLTTLENIAKKADARYDSLVEKLRLQAAKPDDGIIHAKNSGDVRRVFEREVAEQLAKAERELEN